MHRLPWSATNLVAMADWLSIGRPAQLVKTVGQDSWSRQLVKTVGQDNWSKVVWSRVVTWRAAATVCARLLVPSAVIGTIGCVTMARTAERGLELAQLIVAHSLRVGLGQDGKLPTERQLAKDLGVSRSSVRYALAILQAQGRLSRAVRRGTDLQGATAAAARSRQARLDRTDAGGTGG